jgi:hypothetical protein
MVASAVPPLPVLSTVAATYRLTWLGCNTYLALARPLIPLLLALTFCWAWLTWPIVKEPSSSATLHQFLSLLEAAVFALITATIAVPWFRLFLLQEQPQGLASPSHPHVQRFIAFQLLVLLACEVPQLLLNVTTDIVSTISQTASETPGGKTGSPALPGEFRTAVLLITLLAVIIALRVYVVLPGIAAHRRHTAMEGLRRTHGNTLRILAGTLLTALPMLAATLLFALLTIDAPKLLGKRELHALISAISCALTLIALAFGYTFSALMYRHFFPEGSTGTKSA